MKQANDAFLGSEVSSAGPDEAFFHIIPVPCEKTVSYGAGTAKGPAAIIEASHQLETFDGVSDPSVLGIHTTKPVKTSGSIEKVLTRIEHAVEETLAVDAFPIIIGGEHSITPGVINAFRKRGEDFGVVHFDAHADLKAEYEGSPHSHACAMRHIAEWGIPLFQVGIRSMTLAEHDYRTAKGIAHLDSREIRTNGIPEAILPETFPSRVFFSIDVDGFDPHVFPATGTPEPGGFTWHEFFRIAESILSERKLIGFDVVELAPVKALHYPQFTAARLIYDLMGMVQRTL